MAKPSLFFSNGGAAWEISTPKDAAAGSAGEELSPF